MKPIKRRIDIRLKKSLFERIQAISDQLEKTWTDIIEESLGYGLKWYEKKLKKELAQQDAKPVQTQNNNTPEDDDDEDVTPEELEELLAKLYGKKETNSNHS